MALMLKTQRNGTLRDDWYGVYTESDGKRKVVNLNVKIQGTPPASKLVGDVGDTEFENSREEAKKELNGFVEEARRKGGADHLTERLIESKTGSKPEYVRLSELETRWLLDDNYSKGYVAQSKAVFSRFLKFIKERKPDAIYVHQVNTEDAQKFINDLNLIMSSSTVRAYVGMLRGAFKMNLPQGSRNPFEGGKKGARHSKQKDTEGVVHRRPFTPDELFLILKAAEKDNLMGGLITAATCTGMRRGDVCNLRWEDINLKENIVSAKTSKTGTRVEVPIFPPFRKVLLSRKDNKCEFVFPEAERMYRENPDGLTYRFKKIIIEALDGNNKTQLKTVSCEDIETDGIGAINKNVLDETKRNRILNIFCRYCSGESVRKIAETTGFSKGTISNDLHAVESWIDKRFIRANTQSNIKQAITRVTRVQRVKGMRSASVRDWHALRTTFVTLALSANIPIELVKRVTGHSTVDIVLRYYFRPGRDVFKAAFNNALPEVLTGVKSPTLSETNNTITTEIDVLLEKIKSGTADEPEKARFRELAAQV